MIQWSHPGTFQATYRDRRSAQWHTGRVEISPIAQYFEWKQKAKTLLTAQWSKHWSFDREKNIQALTENELNRLGTQRPRRQEHLTVLQYWRHWEDELHFVQKEQKSKLFSPTPNTVNFPRSFGRHLSSHPCPGKWPWLDVQFQLGRCELKGQE